MLVQINSAKCIGIEAFEVTVEVNISTGIGIHLVGLADAAVKESLLRTITALQAIGLKVPGKKIIINLAPADMHKRGGGYDVPIALGIVAASGQLEMSSIGKYIIMGELGLDATVRPVPGSIPIVEMAVDNEKEGCILPYESALEASRLEGCKIFGVHTLADVFKIVCDQPDKDSFLVNGKESTSRGSRPSFETDVMDFSEIMGQETAKRGLEIAASGSHNVILIGSPGSGKSSLAKAMCNILPPMTLKESIRISKIYSVAGKGNLAGGLLYNRPFRAPHSSASVTALIGGGSENILPGEVSLADGGVLFLDEFLEIPKRTLEVLRSPMEDRQVVISRLRTKVVYPADFMLVAATNPCPCGYYGEGDRCTCSVGHRNAYLARLSGPIMDRIDIHLWLKSVPGREIVKGEARESSEIIAGRVCRAREIQKRRFVGENIVCNGQMDSRMVKKYCCLDDECSDFLEKAVDRMGLSARAVTRIIKLSRTIADLDSVCSAREDNPLPISIDHISEAVSYRSLDRRNIL